MKQFIKGIRGPLAIYAGSFDPPTLGHIDIIMKAVKMFDGLEILICDNTNKKHMFTQDERLKLMTDCLVGRLSEASRKKKFISTLRPDCSLAHHAEDWGVPVVLIRGLRGPSDLESELALCRVNEDLVEATTIFIPTDREYEHISSSVVKALAQLNHFLPTMAPKPVLEALRVKLLREEVK